MSYNLPEKTKEFLIALPKCEHHMHIEGALSPEVLFQLSEENGVPLDPKYYSTPEALKERYRHFTGLDDFLFYRNMGTAVLTRRSNFVALAYSWIQSVHAQGVRHAEVFFDPQAHTSRGVPLDDVVEGLREGLARGESEFGVTTMLVMCVEKHRPVDFAMETVRAVSPYVKQGVVWGLGADSTEKGFPPEMWAGVYEEARKLGFANFTMHAGEEGPAQSVRTAVYDMGLRRIDHGTNTVDDPELMKSLAKDGVFLTLCPLSNVDLKVIPDVSESPILTFMNAGIKFSINSDDPSYFSDLIENYYALQDAFKFTKDTWRQLMIDAIEGSWCDHMRKKALLQEVEATMVKYADVLL